MFALVLNNAETGPDTDKPAMYIDGNIHGNEINAAETVLYTAWYLVENHGKLEPITRLVDRCAFYFVPCANPDGRANWFALPLRPPSPIGSAGAGSSRLRCCSGRRRSCPPPSSR